MIIIVARVDCPNHGLVEMDKNEYMKQLSRPDALWVCPFCHELATFDDAFYEEMNHNTSVDDTYVDERDQT
jgi:hypothetical protein